ncbi:MAG: ABC transporter substrate-binding protein [SAR324 cluster bacterium]|nr:ABC transporter substrate-binding protein [SAR324 cluster bacterium]
MNNAARIITLIGIFVVYLVTSVYADTHTGKKVLFVNSYHHGYDWSDGITQGILDTFGARMTSTGKVDSSESKVQLKIIYMDTKRNKTEEFKKSAALKAKEMIDSWQPDVVITSDDIAAKYLIIPYYNSNSTQPFVFCGINIDATRYGFSRENITGMVEDILMKQLMDELRKHAKGDRIGVLGADTLTRREAAALYKSHYNLDVENRYAATFDDWKKEYKSLQDAVDILLVTSPNGISGWDKKAAAEFVLKHTKIPSGATILSAMPYSLIGFTKIAKEQGEWAAKAALEIIGGKSTKDIPITVNHQAQVDLNMRLAKKMGIVFPLDLVERGVFVEMDE